MLAIVGHQVASEAQPEVMISDPKTRWQQTRHHKATSKPEPSCNCSPSLLLPRCFQELSCENSLLVGSELSKHSNINNNDDNSKKNTIICGFHLSPSIMIGRPPTLTNVQVTWRALFAWPRKAAAAQCDSHQLLAVVKGKHLGKKFKHLDICGWSFHEMLWTSATSTNPFS